MTDDKYSSTRGACYIGYITQAISVNLAPLFYLIFQEKFSVTRTQIGQLVFIMFVVQLTVDVLSVYFIKKIGYRRACVISHLFAAAGLVMLSILPSVFSNAYIGILISIIVTSVGSGIIEVMISPIVNSLPNDSGRASMVLLHSFYCWGQALVVLLSTLAMHFLGNDLWNVLPVFWALIPIFNMINFTRVPLGTIEDEEPLRIREFITSPLFILVFIVMICSGASEIAMSQWASYFAEAGLGVTKVVGDILGPCLFAIFMACGRTVYGIFGKSWNLRICLTACCAITVVSYLTAVFSPFPLLSLFGCALCGLGVSLLWPGVISLAAERFERGGTAMFALLALGGDIGCSVGPLICGLVSDSVSNREFFKSMELSLGVSPEQLAIKLGLLVITVFPVIAVFGVIALCSKKRD